MKPLRKTKSEAIEDLRRLLQEAHWAARDVADHKPRAEIARVLDALHAAREITEALEAGKQRLAA